MERLRYPIVLVHGLGGFDTLRIGLGDHLAIRVAYFRAMAKLLEASGAPRVVAAALPPFGAIAERSAALAAFLEQTVAAPHVHLIAHSMGGLDARHYLTHRAGGRRAISLTTLGTPHRGSPLATMTLNHLIDPCARLVRRLGLKQPLERLVEQTAAHRELRPEACAAFNAHTPDVPGVAYFSYGGDPPVAAVQWPVRVLWEILRRAGERETGAGANDGFVPLASARWTGWRGALPADHLSLAGWQLTAAARRAFDAGQFYVGLLGDLERVEAERPAE
jgi:triacylglycerol lipase